MSSDDDCRLREVKFVRDYMHMRRVTSKCVESEVLER